jgi:hypothetical protein
MIRSMNKCMAIQAISAIHLSTWRLTGQWLASINRGGRATGKVAGAVDYSSMVSRMALLAKPRRSSLEKRAIVGAVWCMAVRTVVGYWTVLE